MNTTKPSHLFTSHRAGLIPFWVDPATHELYMYFMKPSDPKFGGDQFQIAKGRIEDGLTELETAVKEATEELGLRTSNIIEGPIEIGTFMKGITVFAALVQSKDDFDLPHYETGETAWLTLKEFEAIGREINLPAVYNAHRKISNLV